MVKFIGSSSKFWISLYTMGRRGIGCFKEWSTLCLKEKKVFNWRIAVGLEKADSMYWQYRQSSVVLCAMGRQGECDKDKEISAIIHLYTPKFNFPRVPATLGLARSLDANFPTSWSQFLFYMHLCIYIVLQIK